ncbi:U20-hexatoxin-Hi1a-like [Haemaphysalis longicornis]
MTRLPVSCFAIFVLVGFVYSASVRLTDCQQRREREQRVTRNTTSGLLVPECDANGEYLSRQCFGQAIRGPPFCACYDREFGQIKGPSRHLVACDCIRSLFEWERSRGQGRGSAPRCNTTSGEFYPVQCSDTKHWCVDTKTGVKKGAEMNGGCSTDLDKVKCAK